MNNSNKSKRYYWIKLKDSFLTSDKVDFLMSQKNGAEYVVLYQCLCLKTINNNGELSTNIGEIIVPYDVNKIERSTKWFKTDTILVALELYKKLGLIYEQDNGILKIADFDDLIGSETLGAVEKRQQLKEKANEAKITGKAVRVSNERILLPNGKYQYIDEKRYGGNGLNALNRANCCCENCGSTEDLVIHHKNGYSNELDDLVVLCKKCHGLAHSEKGLLIDRPKIETGIEPFYQDNRDRDKEIEIRYEDKELDNTILSDSKDEEKKEYQIIIDYLNEKANKNYRYSTNKTKTLINARLKEGFTVDDFKKVIDNKVGQWLNTEYEEYLRPETLFGTKFEGYLNQQVKSKQKYVSPYQDQYDKNTF